MCCWERYSAPSPRREFRAAELVVGPPGRLGHRGTHAAGWTAVEPRPVAAQSGAARLRQLAWSASCSLMRSRSQIRRRLRAGAQVIRSHQRRIAPRKTSNSMVQVNHHGCPPADGAVTLQPLDECWLLAADGGGVAVNASAEPASVPTTASPASGTGGATPHTTASAPTSGAIAVQGALHLRSSEDIGVHAFRQVCARCQRGWKLCVGSTASPRPKGSDSSSLAHAYRPFACQRKQLTLRPRATVLP